MGLCSSSSDVVYVDEGDPQGYEAKIERIEKENAKNFLSVESFVRLQELGCGISEVYAEDAVDNEDMTEELDGMFTLVSVKGQANERQLRMRSFLRKYMLSGGKERAAARVTPFIENLSVLASIKLNQYMLSLEHAFFNRTDCIIVCGNYVTDLELMIRHGFYPKEKEALGIICSVVLALQHLHQCNIIAGDFVATSNVVVTSEGRSKLSLLPLSATRIGYKRKEIPIMAVNEEGDEMNAKGNNNNSDTLEQKNEQPDQSTTTTTTTTNNNNTNESPGAKYRIQTKQSEVRGDQNIDAKALRTQIARDYLLLGRIAAQVFGIRKKQNNENDNNNENNDNDNDEKQMNDTDLIEAASSMKEPAKGLIIGLLDPNQEQRWSYEHVKKHLPDYDWEKIEDIKEEIYPPLSINPSLLIELNVKIMEEAKKKEEGEDLPGTEINIEKEIPEEKKTDGEEEEKKQEKEIGMNVESEFIDHGNGEDDLSDYGDDDLLLPWEAQEVLEGWDHNSTVKALHQLSNHTQSNMLANFASYDATFMHPQVLGDNNELRSDLKEIGQIMNTEVIKISK